MNIYVAYFMLLVSSIHQAWSNQSLDINGENVCQKTVYYSESYTVTVTYTATEYYTTCCAQFLWCWNSCTRSRDTTKTRQETRYRTKSRVEPVCCAGYRRDGNSCPIPICDDGCKHGTCILPNNCSCNIGFEGDDCSSDINECNTTNGGCAQKCVNSMGSYACVCFDGYTYNETTKECKDVNECQLSENVCKCASNMSTCNATCINTIGGFQCSCSPGYELADKTTCVDLDECTDSNNNGNCSHICRNLIGSHSCECPIGLYLLNDSRICNDTNECLLNNGRCSHYCVNFYGSYKCQCRDGYKLDLNGYFCYDIDECNGTNHECEICENKIGGYRCTCSNGFKLNTDNKTCSDFDECKLIEGTSVSYSGCSQRCNNTIGSFQCICDPGYSLASDNRTCSDINECREGSHRCNHICVNTIGSYSCICSDGYKLAEDMLTCKPEACVSLPVIVNGNASCLTGFTGSSCQFRCYQGFDLEGDHERFCLPNHKWNGTQTYCRRRQCNVLTPPVNGKLIEPCNNYYEGKCTASCLDGYFLDGKDINECGIEDRTFQMKWLYDQTCRASTACNPNPCLHGGLCSTKKQSFVCNCLNTMYYGLTCNQGIVKVPQMPIQRPNTTNYFYIEAKPDEELIVEIVSNSSKITIAPTLLTFTTTMNKLRVSVQGLKSGFSTIYFKLLGKNADAFTNPGASTIYVSHTYVTQFSINTEGRINNGCFTENRNNIELLSNSQWIDGTTGGITQVVTQDGNTLPLSLTGGQFSNTNNFVNQGFDGNVIEGGSVQDMCNRDSTPAISIGEAVVTNAVLYSIESIFNTHSPYWISFTVATFSSTLSYNDVEGKLFFGNELLKREDDCTNGYRFEKTHIYYVLETNQDINIMLPTSVISLSKEVKKCFIVDVSGETSTYLTFIPNHEDLLAKFHKELSDLLQIGTLKPNQLSFTRHESNADIFSISGERTFSVYSEKVNVTINLRGNMQWNISDFNKLPNANHSYVLSLTQNGYIHVQLTYELEGNIQNIDKSGQLIHYEEQRLSNSTKSKIIVVSDNNDTFETNFEFVTYENKKPVPSSISVLFEPYRNDLVIIEEFVANSFTNLTSPVGAASLSFRNGTSNLIGLLSANQLQMKQKTFFLEDLGAIRRQSIQTVKLFSLLLDSYVRYDDPWDSLQLEQKFIDYCNSVDDFILNTNIPLDILKVDTAMQKSQIVLKYFCIGKYCLENVKTYLNVPDETLSGVAVMPVALSDFISFEKGNVLFYNVNTKTFNSNVNVAFYSEEHSIDITIDRFSINLSFESGKIIPDDIITINITGYLHGLIRKDPITFRIAGGISKTNSFHSKVNSEILSIVTKLKSTILRRQRSMAIFYSKVKKDVVEKAIAYANNTKTVALLTYKLNTLTDKISQYENLLAGLKPIIDNYLQLQQNVISYNITNFSEKCQVKFCLSDCVPGLTKSICSEVQKLQLIDNVCKFEQSSYTDKEIYTFPKVVDHTDYKDEVFCNRKCPVLTQFFNNVFGRRKRRGIGSRLISAVAIASTFEKLEGTEGAIGALVGSSLGPVGALVGGVIGSIFGSCEKSCSYRQVPYKSYRNITSYGYHSIVHDMIISTCENKQREVEVGKTYYYGCEVESKCADVIIDQSCFDHQKECIEIRKQIDELINDATLKQQIQEYKEYSSLLDIEKRKKDVINAQLQNTLKDNSMTESLSSIANNSESSYKRSYEMFNNSIAAKLNFIEDFEKSKNIIEWSASFSFFHSIFQDFPQRILFNYQMHDKILTSFFDRQNYKKSVSDAAQEILEARMEKFGNTNKRRRRSLQGEATATQAEKNCHVIQKAVFYLYNILVLIQNEINLYEAHILKGSSLEKTASKTYDLLKEQANLLSLGNQITSEIESYYNDIRDGKVTIDSWEKTYTSLITRLEFTASLMEGTDCFSLRDCVDHHIDQMEELLLHTNLAKKLNTTMLKDHYNVLLNSVPTLSEVRNLQTIAANELSASNLRASFCGKRPEIFKLLDGERHVSEGDTIRFIILLKSESDGIEISWKHDRKYIKDASSFTYTSIAKTSDTGIYTCELTNDFGKTYCGAILLHVHEILTFSEGFLPRNGFYRSPDPLILNCKTNYSGQYSRMWYFRAGKTSPKTLLTSNTDSLLIMQNDTGNSGYYSCKIIGQAKTIESEEILVNVLKTTIAVERLSISMNLFKQTLQRTRRSTEDRITDALAAQVSIEKNQIVDLNLTKGIPNDGAKIVFTLHSNNLTKSLNNLEDNETWDSNEDLTKLRDQLFSQVIQLFYKANSSMTFQIEEDLYKVKADSITIEPLAPYCPSGQILNENGLICSDCPPGTRQSSGSCISCSLNTYQELPAQTNCIPCDAPTFTLAEGSISRDQCLIPTTTMTTVSSSTTTRETTTPITATLGKKEDDGTNVAAIGGGIGAVVVVLIAIIAFLLYYRRRKTQKEPVKMNGTSNPVFDDEKADIPVGVLSFDLGSSHGATNEDPQYESIKHVKVRQEKVGFKSGSKEEEGAGYAKPVEPNHYEGVGMGFSNPAYGATFPNEKKNMRSAEYSRKNSYDQLYDCPRPQQQSHRPGSYEKLDVENRNSAKNRDQCYNDMSSMTFKK